MEKLGPLPKKIYDHDLKYFSGELHQWYLKWESFKYDHGLDALHTRLSHVFSKYRNQRLKGLTLLHIHRDIEIDVCLK